MENSNNRDKTKDLIKKYLPVSALIFLTILLMIIFKYNKRDIGRIIEKGKNNLVAFYAENLQPLFATTDISDEDVFNFALYQTLPIDKQNNKVLTVSELGTENQVYEVKPANYNLQTNNYQRFVDYLGLNSKEKEEADSILNLYKKEIYLSVLTNDKNTVAVSSKIGELQRAALADLLAFAHHVNPQKAWTIFPVQKDFNDEVKDFVISTKEIPQNEFLFITPDTAFQTVCTIDKEDLENRINQKLKVADAELPTPPEPPSDWNFDFRFREERTRNKRTDPKWTSSIVHVHKPDSNLFKVVIPIPEIALPPKIADSVRIKLDLAAEKLRKLSFVLGNKNKAVGKSRDRYTKNSRDEDGIELYFQDPIEIVGKTMEMLSQQDFSDWEEFGKKMDSFARSFAAGYSDSLLKNNKAALEALKKSRKFKSKTPKAPKDTIKIN